MGVITCIKCNRIYNGGYDVVTKSVFSTEKLEGLGWIVDGSMKEKMEKTIESIK